MEGSMYFDTTAQELECYGSSGWGACGAAPNVSVNLVPEYAGAVLDGSKWGSNDIGTLTSDICSNTTGSSLTINTAICSNTGDDYNYYGWTTPQANDQSYSLYVRYQLPATFKNFYANSGTGSIQLAARTTSLTSSGGSGLADGVQYSMWYVNTSTNTLTQCGSTTTVLTSTNAWTSTTLGGSGAQTCTVTGGTTGGITTNTILLFKIDMTANSNSTAYVSNLTFQTIGK
jgi:hypothetical protein